MEKSEKLFIRVNNAKAIIQAILFCEQFEIKPVIVGGDDAWKITDFLKARNISIILGGYIACQLEKMRMYFNLI